MPTGLDEKQFEIDIEDYLLAHGGYTKGDRDNFDPELGIDSSEIFSFISDTQSQCWQDLLKRHGGDLENTKIKFISRLVSELDSRGTIDVLRQGVEDQGIRFHLAYSKPASTLNDTIIELYKKNRLAVTRQLHYSTANNNSIDLVLFLNGLPVATVELKNPITGQNVSNAIAQYKEDRNEPGNSLLTKRAVVHFALDPNLAYMSTKLKGNSTEFMPFNRGSSPGELTCGKGNPTNTAGYATSYMWESIWSYDNWLDILLRFVEDIHMSHQSKTILFPRFHQLDAVKKLEEAVLSSGAGESYLIQHSAGSGKSNTIAWLTHRLSTLHSKDDRRIFEKVVVVTDRKVLDNQLSQTVKQFESVAGIISSVNGKRGSKSEELANALTGKARIITVTLETFPYVIEKISNSDLSKNNYAIVVDEAHSSQTGEAALALKQVLGKGTVDSSNTIRENSGGEIEISAEDFVTDVLLHRGKQPNLSFFAFTGTPKDRTVELFGTPQGKDGVKRPFHLYSMRQAIEEGFILDVLKSYTPYKVYFKLAVKSDELGGEEVEAKRASSVLKRWVKQHPELIQEKSAIITEHFKTHTAKALNGRAKAMVVTDSRISAVKYKRAIDQYISDQGYKDIRTLVAFSGTIDNETESSLNGFPESQTAIRFKGDPPYSPGDYQVLIVAEKFQTGFDEPYLQTMFVDKKLIGLNAVQTLSRLNRIAPGKDETFILDFCNDPEDIRQAFQRYYEAVITEITDPNVIYDIRSRILNFGILKEEEILAVSQFFFAKNHQSRNLKAVYSSIDPAVKRFTDLENDLQIEFRDAVDQFIRVYSFLSQVIPFVDESLERQYVYLKALVSNLPSQINGSLDLGKDVVLTHLRIEGHELTSIELNPNQIESQKVFTGEGKGKDWKDELDTLAKVINEMNERFGLELDERDKLESEKLKITLLNDEELKTYAKNNSIENYSLEFTPKWKDAILHQDQLNQRLYDLLLSKPEIALVLERALMEETYEDFRK